MKRLFTKDFFKILNLLSAFVFFRRYASRSLVSRSSSLVFIIAISAYAGHVKSDGLSAGGSITRDLQLREFGQVFHPQTNGYLGANLFYFPLPSQAKLSTEFGKHEGYILRQNFAGYFADSLGRSGLNLGFLWWIERQGWDSQDFLILPNYGKFSLIRSVQTMGFSLARPCVNFGIAGGIQYTNPEYVGRVYIPESDSLFEWGAAVFGPISAQTSFRHSEFRHIRISLNMESKQVLGGKSSGPLTYLPNFDVAYYGKDRDNKDSLRFFWEQNLIAQRLYAEIAVYFPDKALRFAALKYYPDPSKVVSFDVTCYRKDNGDLLWGGGITMPFVRIAYNHADDIENIFGLRGTIVLQLHLGIEKMMDKFVGLNGSRSTPMMSREIGPEKSTIKKRSEERLQELELTHKPQNSVENSKAPKEITARGIVMEETK